MKLTAKEKKHTQVALLMNQTSWNWTLLVIFIRHGPVVMRCAQTDACKPAGAKHRKPGERWESAGPSAEQPATRRHHLERGSAISPLIPVRLYEKSSRRTQFSVCSWGGVELFWRIGSVRVTGSLWRYFLLKVKVNPESYCDPELDGVCSS